MQGRSVFQSLLTGWVVCAHSTLSYTLTTFLYYMALLSMSFACPECSYGGCKREEKGVLGCFARYPVCIWLCWLGDGQMLTRMASVACSIYWALCFSHKSEIKPGDYPLWSDRIICYWEWARSGSCRGTNPLANCNNPLLCVIDVLGAGYSV